MDTEIHETQFHEFDTKDLTNESWYDFDERTIVSSKIRYNVIYSCFHSNRFFIRLHLYL